MIYDVIYIKSGTLSEFTVSSYSDFKDAKQAAESLVLATCREVYMSVRLGTYLPKVVWRPAMEDNLENMFKKLNENY